MAFAYSGLTHIVTIVAAFATSLAFAADTQTLPYSFTYQGGMLQADGVTPLLDQVDFVLEIHAPTGNCLLYSERQLNMDLTLSGGIFSLNIGSSLLAAKRVVGVDPGYTMAQVFSNSVDFPPVPGSCPLGYHPALGDTRILRVKTTPHSTGVQSTLDPDLTMTSAPQAMVADTLQGHTPLELLLISNASSQLQVSQGDLELLFGPRVNGAVSPSDASALHHHDGRYAPINSGGLLGLSGKLGTYAPDGGTAAGSLWYDQDNKTIKFYDGTSSHALSTSSSAVASVAGRTGAVTLSSSDLTDWASATSSFLTSDSTVAATKVSGDIPGKASGLTATLGVASGGTGATSLAGIIKGNGTSAFTAAVSGVDYLQAFGATTNGNLALWNGSTQLVNGPALASSSTASAVVQRDASGNFAAGEITGTGLVTGTLRVTGGSPGTGKVLTSDDSGNATWQAAPGGGSSQWTTSGSNIYNANAGNVGIGTSTPTGTLDVQGGTAADATNGTDITLTAQNAGAGNQNGGGIQLTPGAASGTGNAGLVRLNGRTAIVRTNVTTPWTSIQHSTGAAFSGALNIFQTSSDTMGAIHAGSIGGGPHQYALIGMRQNTSSWNGVGSAVVNGDTLPGLGFAGQSLTGDFSKMVLSAAVQGVVDGTVSSLVVPTGIKFSTSTTEISGLTEKMRISSSGNLGIGTAAPRTKLELGGDGAILATGTLNSGWSEPALGAGTRLLWYPRKGAFRAGEVTGTSWDNANLGYYSIATGYSTQASGDNSIAMGYGVAATGLSATAMGHATTASAARSTAIGRFTTASGEQSLAAGNYTTAESFAQVTLGQYNLPKGGESTFSWVASDPLFAIGNGTGSGASRSTAMMVLKNGNVGIGTITPSQKLDVNGSVNVANFVDVTGTLSNHGVYIRGSAKISSYESGFSYLGFSGGTDTTLSTTNNLSFNVAGAEKVKMDSSGNLGIGTSTPNEKLEVNGNIRMTPLNGGGTTTASIDNNGNIVRTASDERLKENIQPLENSLDKLLNLRGVSYQWKNRSSWGEEREIGFIAQELETVVPEVVRKSPDAAQTRAVNLPNLIALVVEAVKEFHGKFEKQERSVASVQSENKVLKERLEKAEKDNAILRAYLCGKDPAAAFCR